MQTSLKTELSQYSEFIDSDAAQPEEALILYSIVKAIKPHVCVETGTHKGFSSMHIAQALKENEQGILYTADPNEWGARGNFRKTDLEPYIKFIETRGDEMEVPEKIDFLFLDGLHEKEEVMREFIHFEKNLTDEAVVVFHDCAGDGPSVGVNSAIKELGLQASFIPSRNVMRIYCKRDEDKCGHPVNPTRWLEIHSKSS